MFVYNVTVKVDKEIMLSWLQWHKEKHIPEMMSTNLFTENKFFELLDINEVDSSTFVTQYFTDSKEKLNTYIKDHSAIFIQKILHKWNNKLIPFSTVMQTVR